MKKLLPKFGLRMFLCFTALLLAACSSVSQHQKLEDEAFTGVTLHLNPWASNASDTNDGSVSRPLKTMQAAYDRMLPLKEAGRSVRILFYPGIYREQLLGNDARPAWRIPNNQATLILQAKTKGTAIFSGSDVWKNWISQGNGIWTKTWPYDWGAPGAGDDPMPGAPDIPEYVARRELVFVNGERLKQVLNKTELQTGTFHVDELANKLTLKLRSGLNPNTATTEVGVRDRLLYLWNNTNVLIRGLVFQHSVDTLANAAVSFHSGDGVNYPALCANIRIADSQIINNGQWGLQNSCNSVVMRRNVFNDNGYGGLNGFSGPGMRSWLLEDTQTNGNSWRAWTGGYKGWATAGVKVFNVANFTVRRLESKYNYSEGFWVDTNNKHILLEDSVIAHNYWNGVFLEASPGPFTVRNNLICGNDLADLFLSSVARVTLENNRILSVSPVNAEVPDLSAAIFYSELRRKDESYGQFPMRNITFRGNTITASSQRLLVSSWIYYRPDNPTDDQLQADYEAFARTLRSSGNSWYSPLSAPFRWVDSAKGYGEFYTFAAWRNLTKQDVDSSFANPGLSCPG